LAIIKAKANHFKSETEYDTIHYETQAGQVKTTDSDGNIHSSVDELLLKGKLVESVSLNSVIETGLYKVKNVTESPFSLTADILYLLSVKTVGLTTKQTMFNRVDNTVYVRPIYNGTVGNWIRLANKGDIDSLQSSIDDILTDISAINSRLSSQDDRDDSLQSSIEQVESNLNSHHHDSKYLKQTGGNLTGVTSINNDTPFVGKNTGGSALNIGKVDASNRVVLGDSSAKTVIRASSKDLKVSDGTNEYKVFHAGSMGAGSGLDADSVDGIQGNKLALKDIDNIFGTDQTIGKGKSMMLQAEYGSGQAGSLFFKGGGGDQKGRIKVDSSGNMIFYTNTTDSFMVRSSGDTETRYDHVLNAKERQVAVRFKLNDLDKGAGLYMNNTSKQLGMYDWENGSWYFTTDRDSQIVEFYDSIKIKGHKFTIDWTAPSNPTEGDVWVNINS
jgi:hypothetical protein